MPGKSLIKPKQAAAHAASLLQVLALPAVQAALGDTALVQQLQRVVQEAQLGFHNPSGRNSLQQQPGSSMQGCDSAGEPPAAKHDAVSTSAEAGTSSEPEVAVTGVHNSGNAGYGVGVLQEQQQQQEAAASGTPVGLSAGDEAARQQQLQSQQQQQQEPLQQQQPGPTRLTAGQQHAEYLQVPGAALL